MQTTVQVNVDVIRDPYVFDFCTLSPGMSSSNVAKDTLQCISTVRDLDIARVETVRYVFPALFFNFKNGLISMGSHRARLHY